MQLDDLEGALKNLKEAIKLNSQDPKFYELLGEIKHRNSNFEEAASAFDKALDLKPEETSVYLKRAHTKIDLENYSGAISDCDAAIYYSKGKRDENSSAYTLRGVAYAELNMLMAAREDLKKAVQLNPQDKLSKENLEEAEEDWKVFQKKLKKLCPQLDELGVKFTEEQLQKFFDGSDPERVFEVLVNLKENFGYKSLNLHTINISPKNALVNKILTLSKINNIQGILNNLKETGYHLKKRPFNRPDISYEDVEFIKTLEDPKTFEDYLKTINEFYQSRNLADLIKDGYTFREGKKIILKNKNI